MGNWLGKVRDKDDGLEHRRIYVGDVPTILDAEVECDTSDLHGNMGQSFTAHDTDKQGASAPVQIIPVRRQSILTPGPYVQRHPDHVNKFPSNKIVSSRYTAWNFLPKNLFEQFRRIVNFYFLCVAILQTVLDSPVSPVTSTSPLAFVIFVTALKQGYEDWLRHKADEHVNNRPVRVIKDGEVKYIKSADVRVGDIIKLEGEEQVPTDLLLLGSSDDYHRCQINTANLDGETNLKIKYCPPGMTHFNDPEDFLNLHAIIECDPPNQDLYNFNGSILIPPRKMHKKSSLAPVKESSLGHLFAFMDKDTETFVAPLKERTSLPAFGASVTVPLKFYSISCNNENILLRGSRLKNTQHIFGLALYTGVETKLAQNSKRRSVKFSTVERTVNAYLIVFIAILLIVVMACTTTLHFWKWFPGGTAWYLSNRVPLTSSFDKAKNIFSSAGQFLILFNYIIPISLYVTMELQKFIGSKYMVWDADMASEKGHPPLCNTSDLNEELGQIEYLFSDKTGTLTENIMEFRCCSINAEHYEFKNDTLYLVDKRNGKEKDIKNNFSDEVNEFLVALSLCHTVQLMPKRKPSTDFVDLPKTSTELMNENPTKLSKLSRKMLLASSIFSIHGKKDLDEKCTTRSIDTEATGCFHKAVVEEPWEFQASSPDEKALVESCYKLNVQYLGEKNDVLTVKMHSKAFLYKRYIVLEFDPDRKCMSVIVEDEQGRIMVITKGAETAVLPKCISGDKDETMRHVLEFALKGMRTLLIAKRFISKSMLNNYLSRLRSARRLLKGRDETIREIYRDIETNLTVIGATGVEDQLQPGVPETLSALGEAGIHVWMLTGDKLETGINVAFACGLINSTSKQRILSHLRTENEIRYRIMEFSKQIKADDETTLIVDGESLAAALRYVPELFRDIALKSTRVVCCRLAPLQKAQVVSLVKSSRSKPITAAIGDGANDVAMIQEAHIGIGILGKEGRQAARCSDFALARFSFLKKAILVHGHWFYVRLSLLAIYFFYKNVVFVCPQLLFCFHSKFSSQALLNGMYLMMFNIFFSAFPILIYGLFEQDYSAETLLKNPKLYKRIGRNAYMRWSEFILWTIFAIWHAFVCYFLPYFSWSTFNPISDLASYGFVVVSGVVSVTNMKLFFETHFICWPFIASEIYSFFLFTVFSCLYSEVDLRFVFIDPVDFRGVYFTTTTTIPFWFLMILVNSVALFPDLLYAAVKKSSRKLSNNIQKLSRHESRIFKMTYHVQVSEENINSGVLT